MKHFANSKITGDHNIDKINKIMKSKFCISSTAPFQKINKSLTNQSPTKQTFSFSKGNRFQQPKPICPLNTYGGDFINRKASGTGIGYGNRSDFTKCLTSSPSSKYNLKTFWDQNASKKKGPGFALGRDKVSFNSYISKDQFQIPSSVHYNNDKPIKTSAPKYTLRQKTLINDKKMTVDSQNTNPGPGTYINPQMESQPSFKHISKFQSLSYGQSKSKRFQSNQTVVPGPGKYKNVHSMPKTGNYILSQNKGGTMAKFDGLKRQTVFDKVYKKELSNPGPGYYQVPSEFGQYDGDIYNSLRQGKRSNNGWIELSQRKVAKKQ